jgi:hypothetical protein
MTPQSADWSASLQYTPEQFISSRIRPAVIPRDTKCVVLKYTLVRANWSIIFSRSFMALNYTVKVFSALNTLKLSGHYMYNQV